MIDGRFLIGGTALARADTFKAIDAASGLEIEPSFSISTEVDVADACRWADAAFDAFRETTAEQRAVFLETIADRIEAIGDMLIERAATETGLTRPRLIGERARTTGQLRMFARLLREGRWAGITMDAPLPDRQPNPRPDLRSRRIPLGPVAVFGASNFPLAFSVAGGDTASALAAGCPVIGKAHPAHPGTAILVAGAIRDAVAECGLPEGVFSLLQGPGNDLGAALVADPRIKAVGFTGGRAGGLALLSIAQARPEPIPVFAEMSSVNPVLLFPGALAARADTMGRGYIASLTLGAGQFCTNPGLVIGLAGDDLDTFVDAARNALSETPPHDMLTPAIHQAYAMGVDAMSAHPGVELIETGPVGDGAHSCRAAIFSTDAASFLADPALAEEIFGAASIMVRCKSIEEMRSVVSSLEGQLTATLHCEPCDAGQVRALIPLLERKVGRIVANGWPTGVEVGYAMVHGGPFPATADGRTTSVGAMAIDRFLRPVCYQDLPDDLLPLSLQKDNPLELPATVNR